MIVLDIEQYQEEWWSARRGVPTASMFAKIVTSTGKKSATFNDEAYRLASEIITGSCTQSEPNDAMKRGTDLEPQAREFYELVTGSEVSQPGIVYRDNNLDCACSPDGFIGRIGGLEIKCPLPSTHTEYLHCGVLPTKYKPQVFGSLWVCDEIEWWDFMSYHPDMDPLIIRVDRDSDGYSQYSNALCKYMPEFIKQVKQIVKDLKK